MKIYQESDSFLLPPASSPTSKEKGKTKKCWQKKLENQDILSQLCTVVE
jgi:hypothetical protein